MTSVNEVFWAEIAPCEHLVQIYEDDGQFLASLGAFVGEGLRAGESVIVLATASHLRALEDRIEAQGYDAGAARLEDRYIAVDADLALSKFIVNEWPDEELFRQLITELVARARNGGRRVRAFGEMVALLWTRGHNGATVRLEHLWNAMCREEEFSLFCAYPRIGFTQDMSDSIREICDAHSRVVSAA